MKQKNKRNAVNSTFLLLFTNAADRNRTGTGITTHGILSPGRLPIPPLRHFNRLIILPHSRAFVNRYFCFYGFLSLLCERLRISYVTTAQNIRFRFVIVFLSAYANPAEQTKECFTALAKRRLLCYNKTKFEKTKKRDSP